MGCAIEIEKVTKEKNMESGSGARIDAGNEFLCKLRVKMSWAKTRKFRVDMSLIKTFKWSFMVFCFIIYDTQIYFFLQDTPDNKYGTINQIIILVNYKQCK